MRRLIPILTFAALGVSAGLAAAATSGLTVGLNEGVTLPLRGEAGTVAIDNPAVADVMVPNGHTVMVLGKGYGSTRLTVTDRAGHRLVDTAVTVVTPDDGRVTVYRGGAGSDYACVGGRCHMLGETAGGGGAGADAATSSSNATIYSASGGGAPSADAPSTGGDGAGADRASAPHGQANRDAN